ncbi:MAG: hypothetical protein FWE48_05470, partial [Coriobacteriia bacterium]|nr:hypothetical protein [Coriobacteriia bacterium]
TRTTAGTVEYPGALSISKSVEGDFANLSTPFEFEVILSVHELCPHGEELLLGRIVDANNEPVGDPISFPNGTAVKVSLADGQRLVFDELTIGTGFEVTEQATAEFVASVELFVNGEPVAIEPNQYPDMELSVGSHVIGFARNTVDFTNKHLYLAPTGLRLGGTPISLIVVALAISALLLVSKTSLFYREIHPSVQASAEIYKRRM